GPSRLPFRCAAVATVDVPMRLAAGELAAGPWRVAPLPELVAVLLQAGGPDLGRPRIVAVDGRSGSGKTTLAHRLRTGVPGAAVACDPIGEVVIAGPMLAR